MSFFKNSLLMCAVLANLQVNAGENPVGHIIVYKDNVNPVNETARIAAQRGLKVGRIFKHSIKGAFISQDLNPEALEALKKNPTIAYIEKNGRVWKSAQSIPKSLNRTQADQASSIDGFDEASAVEVAILDTGIDNDHPDLNINTTMSVAFTESSKGPRFNRTINQSNSPSAWDDKDGHGTHVSGTVGAIDNNIGVVGVAPGASLSAVKVLNDDGSGSYAQVIAGIDYVAANAATFSVANMSLGGGFSQALNDAVAKAVNKGVAFVVAAGNENSNAANYSPASEPSAITVSAIVDTDGLPGGLGPSHAYGNDDTLASFSNYGNLVDVAAPGVGILSTWNDGTIYSISGTSMASPHVAGAVALFISRNGRDLNNDQMIDGADVSIVEQRLKDTGWQLGEPSHFDGGSGEALVNVLSLAGVSNSNTDFFPNADAGNDITLTDSDENGIESITLSAINSSDDNGIVSYEWYLGSNLISTNISLTLDLSIGVHSFTLKVTDTIGQTSTDEVVVTIKELAILGETTTITDLSYRTEGGKNKDAHLSASLILKDDQGQLINGAIIKSDVFRDGNYIGSTTVQTNEFGTTDIFTIKNASSGCYTTQVTSIEVSGLTWDGQVPSNEFCK